MLHHGNVTIYVSDFRRALAFYTESLGFELCHRAGDHWAEVDAGGGLRLGLHPETPHAPPPGTAGSLAIGLRVTDTMESAIEALEERGVLLEGAIREDDAVRFLPFSDPDGNPLYLFELKAGP
ncbi:MAG: VOC family protein [Planctomycetota bacterium]|jgi:catechol 2,3-dioxygenase-like lactoylglutathione lyase family enzyme